MTEEPVQPVVVTKNKTASTCCSIKMGTVVTVLVIANIVTLMIILVGVLMPYIHLISFFAYDEETYYAGYTDEYCVYLEDVQASFTWSFDSNDDQPFLYTYVTYWWDPFEYDDPPNGYYIYGFESATQQTFFGWNSTTDETREVAVDFDGSTGQVTGFNFRSEDTSGLSFDIDYGYSDTTELLYRSLYVDRPYNPESANDYEFMSNWDAETTDVLIVMIYEDYTQMNTEPTFVQRYEVNLQDRTTKCSWNSKATRRTTLVRQLLQETGFNLNAFLTLNYLMFLIIFRTYQPTKSRLPLMIINAAVVFLISTASIIINIAYHGVVYAQGSEDLSDDELYTLDQVKYAAIVVNAIQQIMAAFCMLIYSLHIARYFYLKTLYAYISKKEKVGPNDFRIHRRLTSNLAFFIYSALIFLVILAVFIPIAATDNLDTYSYNTYGKTMIDSFVYAIRTLVLVIIGVCFCVDIIVNVRELIARKLKAFWWFFTHGDPLYFRFEMTLFAFIHLIIHPAFGMQMHIRVLRNRPFSSDPFLPMFTRAGIASEILYQIYNNFYLNFLICGGLICIIQIYCLFRDRRRKSVSAVANGDNPDNEQNEIEVFLQDKNAYKLMKSYCEKEWSTENLLCWEKLWDFKTKGTETADNISEIYNTFIRSGSNMEVNIPSKTRKALAEVVGDKGENIKDSSFEPFFTDLYNQVMINLADTFSRLKFTEDFEQYETKQKMLNNVQFPL